MDPYKITFETWDTLAEIYYEKFSAIRIYDEAYARFYSLIRASEPKILEIGCGPGNVARFFMDHYPSARFTGLDISPNMISYAKKMVPQAHFEVFDARNLDRFSGNYDAILNGFCLPYQSKDDLDKFLTDSHSLLHPDGILYLSCIEGDYSKSGMEVGSKPEYRVQVFYYSEQYLTDALKTHGYEILESARVAYPSQEDTKQIHIIVIARKRE